MVDTNARLDRLESIEAIKQLKYDYCAACDDDHNGEAVAALFVPDGVWEATGVGRAEGTDAIADLMFGIRSSGSMRNSAHQVFNPRIVIDDDGERATGHWRLLMVYTANTDVAAQRHRRVIGYYDEVYDRVDGRWMFRHLDCTVEETGAYDARDTSAWHELPTTPGTRLPTAQDS